MATRTTPIHTTIPHNERDACADNGQTQLLRMQAFNQLTELLSDRLEAGQTNAAPEVETPQVLQAFIQVGMYARGELTWATSARTRVPAALCASL